MRDRRRNARAAVDLERRRLTTILDQLPIGVVLAEAPTGRIVQLNEAVRRIWGVAANSAGIHEYSADYVGYHFEAGRGRGRRYDNHEWPLARALSHGELVSDEVVEVERPDGSRVVVSLSAAPVKGADGEIVAAVVATLDVTERERLLVAEHAARDEAEAAQRAAERANRAKSDFLTTMSHELRTPLNAIQGHVQLLELELYGPVSPAQRDALGRVQRAQQHLLGIINDILNFARLEAGRVEYDVRPVLVADVVHDILVLVQPQMEAHGLSYDVELGDVETRVLADREKLGQVLLNLLSNAVKFTPSPRANGSAGGLRIDLVPHHTDNDVVLLRVSDTGIGIPADRLPSIFDPFVQVRSELTRPQSGTGLGLAISRDLARGMGAELSVESEIGKGSVFAIALRRA